MWNSSHPFFWYKAIFTVQLLFSETLFTMNFEKKKHFWLRLSSGFILCVLFSFAFPTIYNAAYSVFVFTAMFALSILALKFAYDESFKNVLFSAIIGYTVQHVASEAFELFSVAFSLEGGFFTNIYGSGVTETKTLNWFVALLYLWTYGMTYWAAYLIAGRKVNKYGVEKLSAPQMIVIGGGVLFIDVVFSSLLTYAVSPETDKLALSMLHGFNIICCVLVICLLLVLPLHLNTVNELEIVKEINREKTKQYELSTENVKLINFKCHDLKHQIRRFAEAREINSEAISEIENIIADYDATVKTENEALDVVLTEKSLICKNLGIRFACIADGRKVGFMKQTDIYSLFGNILDNAIEAVKAFPKNERTVSLNVKSVNNFVIVTLRNRYKGEIIFRDGLPETTKTKEKGFHGYGMKSVRYTVRQYGGELSIVAKDGIFNLNIVFPIEKEGVLPEGLPA